MENTFAQNIAALLSEDLGNLIEVILSARMRLPVLESINFPVNLGIMLLEALLKSRRHSKLVENMRRMTNKM